MAKLWKKPIELIDIDKRSIKTSKANAKLNFVNSFIKVKKGNGLNITNEFQYDIIVMNILSNTILKNIKSIDRKLNNNGRAIIAGILNNQKYMILNKLRGLGLELELEYEKLDLKNTYFYKLLLSSLKALINNCRIYPNIIKNLRDNHLRVIL